MSRMGLVLPNHHHHHLHHNTILLETWKKRQVIPPKRYVETDLVAYALTVEKGIDSCEEPFTYEEVVSYEDSSRWMIAMQEEMESFHKNGTCDLVKLPKEKKVVHCKWVFKRKNTGS